MLGENPTMPFAVAFFTIEPVTFSIENVTSPVFVHESMIKLAEDLEFIFPMIPLAWAVDKP